MAYEYHGKERLNVERQTLTDQEKKDAIKSRLKEIADIVKPDDSAQYAGSACFLLFKGRDQTLVTKTIEGMYYVYSDHEPIPSEHAAHVGCKLLAEHLMQKFGRALPKRRS